MDFAVAWSRYGGMRALKGALHHLAAGQSGAAALPSIGGYGCHRTDRGHAARDGRKEKYQLNQYLERISRTGGRIKNVHCPWPRKAKAGAISTGPPPVEMLVLS
jgi:hypothetical protein